MDGRPVGKQEVLRGRRDRGVQVMGLVSGDTVLVLDWLGDLWSWCACGYEKHVVATDKDRLTMIIVIQ